MRRVLLLVALAAAACASSNSATHKLSLGVTESRRGPSVVAGSHMFHVYVKNVGTEPVTIRSVHADISGVDSLDIDNATQEFDESVAPGETARLDMFMTVLRNQQAASRGETMMSSISSLRMIVSAESPSGNFIETGDYPVSVERGDF